MTPEREKPVAAIQVSPQSARILEASIAAGSSGPAFWLLVVLGTAVSAALFLAGVGGVIYASVAAMDGQPGATPALVFGLAFCAVAGTVLAFQAQLLRRLRNRQKS